jgi:hypothetical protein
MKEVIFGIISGIVASMGMGGGVILILLFSLFSDISQHIVQGINLIFFIPTSIVAIYMNIKNKNIDYKSSKTVILSGTIGAILGSILAIKIDNNSLKKYFGIFLIGIAIFEIYSFFKQYILKRK